MYKAGEVIFDTQGESAQSVSLSAKLHPLEMNPNPYMISI